MSVYTLIVKIPQAGNKEVSYSVTLNKLHESHPEDYFRSDKNRLNLCEAIQQSARQVSSVSLDSIISKWISEIKCGLHYTTVTLDLPSEFSSSTPEQVPTSPINNSTPIAKNTEITAKSKQPVRSSTTQPTAQPETQPTTKPITQPVAQTITKPATQPAAQPSSHATSQQNSVTQPVTRPANPSPSKNSTQEASTSPSDIRSDTNKADF